MSPRKKKVEVVEEKPKKVDSIVKKNDINIEDVIDFFKKHPEHLIKEKYYSRYSFFLDFDFRIKK